MSRGICDPAEAPVRFKRAIEGSGSALKGLEECHGMALKGPEAG